MRPLESYAIYLALFTLWHTIAPFTYIAAWALLAVTTAHLFIEHPRWQLSLLYLVAAQLVYSILLVDDSSAWPGSLWFIFISSSLLMATSALACLFPVAKFPELTGRWKAVGIAHRFWPTKRVAGSKIRVPQGVQDPQRFEHLGVTAFYPSSLEVPSRARYAPFLSKGVIAGLAGFMRLPAAIFSYVSLGRIRAVADLPMAPSPSKFPVVLLSHGLGGTSGMYAITACELASQGFVVLGPTHNDQSASLAELPEGRTVPYKQPPAYGSAEMHTLRQQQLLTRAAELSFILDVATEAEKTDSWPVSVPFAGRLDLARVGVIGHSFGAAAATLTAEQDERVRALVANDLWMLPLPVDLQTHGLQRPGVPALLTQSQAWTKWAEHSDQVVAFTKASRDARLLMYPHTGHSNYSDVPLFSQLVARKLGQIGAADFRQAAATINRAQVAFLKQALATGHGDVDEGRKKIDAPEQMFKEILQAKKAQILARSPPA